MRAEIVEELTGLACNAQLVEYGSRIQVAMLRAAAEIRKLRALLTAQEAETYLASIRDSVNGGASND